MGWKIFFMKKKKNLGGLGMGFVNTYDCGDGFTTEGTLSKGPSEKGY